MFVTLYKSYIIQNYEFHDLQHWRKFFRQDRFLIANFVYHSASIKSIEEEQIVVWLVFLWYRLKNKKN